MIQMARMRFFSCSSVSPGIRIPPSVTTIAALSVRTLTVVGQPLTRAPLSGPWKPLAMYVRICSRLVNWLSCISRLPFSVNTSANASGSLTAHAAWMRIGTVRMAFCRRPVNSR
jgi:hypothetical protein